MVCANIRRGALDNRYRVPNDSGVLEILDAQTFPSKFPTLSPHYYTVPRQFFSDPKMRDLE